MKNMLLRGVIFAFLFCVSGMAMAQKNIPEALQKKLAAKTTLSAIMKVVDDYYENEGKEELLNKNNNEEEEANAYIHWKRWEWWMSSHLDGQGKFVNYNIKNTEALSENDRRWNNEINKTLQKTTGTAQRSALSREQGSGANAPDDGGGPDAPFGDWTFLGPTADGTGPGDIKGTGRLDRIAFHPTDANTIYVGAPSGNLWKTTNGGTSWVSVTDGLANPGVAGIAISPVNGSLLYLLTGDGDSYNSGFLVFQYGSSRLSSGVFKSTDGGTSWTPTGTLFAGDYEGHRLTASPTNGNFLLAATSQGIYRTINGGSSWEQVQTGEYWDIKFKPGSDSVVYASTGSGIFYSNNGGRLGTWVAATTDFSVAAATRIELAVTPNNVNYVYALGGASAAGSFTGIFRSVNSGVSYTRRSNTPNILGSEENGLDGSNQGNYDLGITAKPTDAEFIATCGLNVWVSSASNGGSAMVWSTKYREGYAGAANKYIHPDVHAVAYNALNNNLFACSDGGVYRSTDDGLSWTNITNSISTGQYYGMAMRDADADGDGDGVGFLAGAQDNGMKHRPDSGPTVFDHIICCDGYGTAIDADNPDILYMNINSSYYKSINGGTSITFLFSGTFYGAIAVDYTDPDTVYMGTTSGVRRSFNGFTTNATVGTGTSTRRVLTACPANQARLYGSGGTNLVRSDDRAATWTVKNGTAGWPVGTFTINDIESLATNSAEVYASFGGYSAGNKVMRSTTGGDSWTNWSGSLPNIPCYGLAVAPEGVYVGTEFGVYFRSYTMTDWVPFYNGMPRTPVTELVVNNNGLIYASTFGRGIWLGNRRTACTSLLTISGSRTGPYYYEAANGVNATITAPGTNGDSVFAHAGDTVVLRPGFEMKGGSFFKAYIAPCSNGGLPVARQNDILIPHLTEIKPAAKKPATARDYYAVVNGNIEFHLTQKGDIEMLAKQSNGTWMPFYPADAVLPGFYSIPLPNVFTPEIKLTLNGRDLERLK
jgi:hypothetical protein